MKRTGPKLLRILQFIICSAFWYPGSDVTDSNGNPIWYPEHLEMLLSWSTIPDELAMMLKFVCCAVHWQMAMFDNRAWCRAGLLFFQWRSIKLTSQNCTSRDKSTSTTCLSCLKKVKHFDSVKQLQYSYFTAINALNTYSIILEPFW